MNEKSYGGDNGVRNQGKIINSKNLTKPSNTNKKNKKTI